MFMFFVVVITTSSKLNKVPFYVDDTCVYCFHDHYNMYI